MTIPLAVSGVRVRGVGIWVIRRASFSGFQGFRARREVLRIVGLNSNKELGFFSKHSSLSSKTFV